MDGLGIIDPMDAERAEWLMTPTPLRTHTDVFELHAPPWSGPRFYIAASETAWLFEGDGQASRSRGLDCLEACGRS